MIFALGHRRWQGRKERYVPCQVHEDPGTREPHIAQQQQHRRSGERRSESETTGQGCHGFLPADRHSPATDEPHRPHQHLPPGGCGHPGGGRGREVCGQPRREGAALPVPQQARHQGEGRQVVLVRTVGQRVLRRQPGGREEDGGTTVGGGQSNSSLNPATGDQDGPNSVHSRAVKPLGHGVEESQRDRAASAQPSPHPAQEQVVAV